MTTFLPFLSVFAFLSVIPEGNLLADIFTAEHDWTVARVQA